LKFDFFNPQSSSIEMSRPQTQKDPNLSTMRPAYQRFVKKSFPTDVQNRLKTFEKFAFSHMEREDHKDIVPFLNDLKPPTEPSGCMSIVDLWSKQLQRDVLKQSALYEEKKIVEKFGFYFHKNKKMSDFKKLHRGKEPTIFSKKQENIYKDLIHMRTAKEEFMKKQDIKLKELNFVRNDPQFNTDKTKRIQRKMGVQSEEKFHCFMQMVDNFDRENIQDFEALEKKKEMFSYLSELDREFLKLNRLKKLIS